MQSGQHRYGEIRSLKENRIFKDAMTNTKDGELADYKDKTAYVYTIMYNWGEKNI